MKLYQFLQEDNGNLSSTRLAFLLWTTGALVFWGIASLHGTGLAALPDSINILIAMLMSGKVVQKFAEKSGTPPEDKGTSPT